MGIFFTNQLCCLVTHWSDFCCNIITYFQDCSCKNQANCVFCAFCLHLFYCFYCMYSTQKNTIISSCIIQCNIQDTYLIFSSFHNMCTSKRQVFLRKSHLKMALLTVSEVMANPNTTTTIFHHSFAFSQSKRLPTLPFSILGECKTSQVQDSFVTFQKRRTSKRRRRRWR